jgi:hypothetical protein
MIRHPDRDGNADEAAMAARHNWIAEHLGAQWRSDGGGVYRFVGPASRPLVPALRQRRRDAVEAPSTQLRSPW